MTTMEQVNTTRRGFFGHAAGAYMAIGALTVGVVASSPLMEKIKAFDALYRFGESMPDETDEDDAAFKKHIANLDIAMYDALNTAPATREEALAYADFVMRPEVFGASMADPTDLALMMGRISDFLRSQDA